jgi:hypothetical protein
MKTMKIAVSRELLSTVSTHREKVTLDSTDFTDVAAVVMTTTESQRHPCLAETHGLSFTGVYFLAGANGGA